MRLRTSLRTVPVSIYSKSKVRPRSTGLYLPVGHGTLHKPSCSIHGRKYDLLRVKGTEAAVGRCNVDNTGDAAHGIVVCTFLSEASSSCQPGTVTDSEEKATHCGEVGHDNVLHVLGPLW